MVPSGASINLVVDQKADFQVFFTVMENGNPKDLTGFSVLAAYKQDYTYTDAQAVSFTAQVADAANGSISVALTYLQTAAMETNMKYVYDVVLVEDLTGFRTRIADGKITVRPGVTI